MGRLSSSGVSDEECMMGDAHLPQPLNVDSADDEGVSNGGCSPATAVVVDWQAAWPVHHGLGGILRKNFEVL